MANSKIKDFPNSTTIAAAEAFLKSSGSASTHILRDDLYQQIRSDVTAETKSADFSVESGINRNAIYYITTGATNKTATFPAATVADLGSIKVLIKADAGVGELLTSGVTSGNLTLETQYDFTIIQALKTGPASYGWIQIAGNVFLELKANNPVLNGEVTGDAVSETGGASKLAKYNSSQDLVMTGDLLLSGFAQLGMATGIKAKIITSTAPGAGGGLAVSHGLTGSKILMSSVFIEQSTGSYIPPFFGGTASTNYYTTDIGSTTVSVNLLSGSTGVANDPLVIFIFYKE